MPPSDDDDFVYVRCIYSWEPQVRTEVMRSYADVARHDISGHRIVIESEPVVEWRNSWAGEWDMDDG